MCKKYKFMIMIILVCVGMIYCCITDSFNICNDMPIESLSMTQNDSEYNYNSTSYNMPSVWIGDSRTVGLSNYVDIDYIAEIGCGLDYFWQNYDYISSLREHNVFINLGVNDLYNIDNYIYTLNTISQDFLNNNNIYIISVNPCNYDYTYLNVDILNFNYRLSTELDYRYKYINTYYYLASYGFDTVDGLHYTEYTYYDIYNYVMNNKY